jgi:phytoene dehydrogenase-like protein
MAARRFDAVVIGSGPNGLAAAITLARAGRSVQVIEARDEIGGGACSAELTLPGYLHDVCSAVHPMALQSDFFRELPLQRYGLEWIHSPAELAHPRADGKTLLLHRSLDQTAAQLGRDEATYRRVVRALLDDWPYLKSEFLRPLRFPSHPLRFAKFGLPALMPIGLLARTLFREEPARALFAGIGAHTALPFSAPAGSAIGLALLLAGHDAGWPIPRGGSVSIARALRAQLESLGGEVVTGCRVETLGQIPSARAVLFDLTPRQIVRIAGGDLGRSFAARLGRFRYGPGVFKLDWALRAPIPWRDPRTALAITVHLGATIDEMAQSERAVAQGRIADRPYVLLAQPSLFDPTRAPAGGHTAWAYCHVPHGSTADVTARIEEQIERFAPGFRDCILARSALGPGQLEARNANLVGGDINGGALSLPQIFLRPTARTYATDNPRLFICSSSTPPGGGVHGLCGHHAAKVALATILS